MAEFIGSTISLISKRDIRYVGTLHKIDSESSTVALEDVKSYGTEGRRSGDEEVAASDKVYNFIVFRGSDVKDLRIEKSALVMENKPPQVPDDPAIIGNTRAPEPPAAQASQPSAAVPAATKPQEELQGPPFRQDGVHQQRSLPSHYQQHSQQSYYPSYGPSSSQGFRPQAFPPGPGLHHAPYGAPPPGWYPPPAQGFPHAPPGPYYNPQMQGPPQQNHPGPHGPIHPPGPAPPISAGRDTSEKPEDKPTATVRLPSANPTPVPPSASQPAPPPPTESKPDVSAALAPPAPSNPAVVPKEVPVVNGRIVPAVPRVSPAVKPAVPVKAPLQAPAKGRTVAPAASAVGGLNGDASLSTPATSEVVKDPNADAIAAVAAAMAKLPGPSNQTKPHTAPDPSGGMDNLTKKVNEMRTQDRIRTSSQQGTGGYAAGNRGRGGHRGGRRGGQHDTTEANKKSTEPLPNDDYDFVTANAKFNKQDLVKEAIAAGSPIGSPVEGSNGMHDEAAAATENGDNPATRSRKTSDAAPVPPSYNKASSFFDTLSSDVTKEHEESSKSSARSNLRGREFRNEERKLNLETFGQGSVDAGYGRGYRGRGRGRGGYRGRGGGYRGRGAPRGEAVSGEATA